MARTIIHVILAAAVLAAAAWLLAVSIKAHIAYARATGEIARVDFENPATMPDSVRRIGSNQARSEHASWGIIALTVVAMIAAWATRRPVWFMATLAGAAMIGIDAMNTWRVY